MKAFITSLCIRAVLWVARKFLNTAASAPSEERKKVLKVYREGAVERAEKRRDIWDELEDELKR
jgi:hypothetical protein